MPIIQVMELVRKMAMMLGSYTWSYDALLWDGLSKGDRIYYALHNLATILGGQVYDEFISGISKAGHWIRMRLEDLHFSSRSRI